MEDSSRFREGPGGKGRNLEKGEWVARRRRWRSQGPSQGPSLGREKGPREASEGGMMRKRDLESCGWLSRDGRGGGKGEVGRVEQNVQLQVYEKHFKKVICPFCYSSQEDKVAMANHLDDNCLKRNTSFTAFLPCEIQPSQKFSCTLCFYSGESWEDCLVHIYSRKHTNRFAEVNVNKDLMQFLFCLCCRVNIPCTYVQIKFHLEHENHRVRSESYFHPDHYLSRGVGSIYCLKNNTFIGKCLNCLYTSGPLEIIKHLDTAKHKAIVKVIYCCVCHEEVFLTLPLYHFASKSHFQREKCLFLKNNYKLCFYCGFACETLNTLFWHMKSNCTEIKKIRKEVKGEIEKTKSEEEAKGEVAAGCAGPHLEDEGKDAAPGTVNEKEEIDKGKCILVKADSDVVELFHVLKNFGKITLVDEYNEEYIVMKFNSQKAVTNVKLVQNFIKVNGQKVEIQFF